MRIKGFYMHILVLLCALYFITPFKIYAAEKEVDVAINEDYPGCTFKVTCERDGDYEIVLKAPSGEFFDFKQIEPKVYSCTIKNVKKGNWSVIVKNKNINEIGKISVSVTAAKTDDDEMKNEISVGRDIVGLKIFFKNNKIVATWTDENCKSVSFQIVNLDNSELLITESSSTKYFEYTVPDDIDNFSVSATSSGNHEVEGATATYTFERIYSLNGTITYPDIQFTNADKITASVNIKEAYGFCVEVNGHVIMEEPTKPAGTYDVEIPLDVEGDNHIQFYLVDEKGNMVSTDKSIFKDVLPPTLTLMSEYDGMTTTESEVLIEGTVANFDRFVINGRTVEVSTDGYFSYNCILEKGENTVSILATDKAGNETFYNINIIVPQEDESFLPLLLPVIAIIIILLVFKSPKKKSKPSKEKIKPNNDDNHKTEENIPLDIEMPKMTVLNASQGIKEETGKKKKPKKEKKEKIKKEKPVKIKEKKKNIFALFLVKFLNHGGIFKFLLTNLIYVALILVLFRFVLMIGFVPTESMNPTIKAKDLVIYNRLAYMEDGPTYGDIVSFKKDDTIYCKRIVALAGDNVSFKDGYLYINNVKIEEWYIDKDIETNCIKTFTVPQGFVFVLGDNRENSYDSRYWENPYVEISAIYGKHLSTIPTSKYLK